MVKVVAEIELTVFVTTEVVSAILRKMELRKTVPEVNNIEDEVFQVAEMHE